MSAEPLPHQTMTMAAPRLRHRPAPLLTLFPDEPLAIAVQRTTIEQFDHALWVLRHELDRDLAVHETRKALKRIRAILRLIRIDIGRYAYKQENTVLRDTSRKLSVVRSAAVMVETARQLLENDPTLLDPIAARRLVVGLEDRRDTLRTPVIHDRQMLTDVVTTLLCARSRYAGWPIVELAVSPDRPDRRPLRNEFAAIAPGLERTYRRGQRAMLQAATTRSAFDLHYWRKRSKYLRHQHEFLEELWPPVIGAAAESFAELSDRLGADHDLAELSALLATRPTLILDPSARYRFLAAVERRRRDQHPELLALGARVFGETPRAFVRRLGSYWEYARR